MRSQLLKGTTALLVLGVRRDGELYGYEIGARIRAWFPWSVPALVSGAAGPDAEAVSAGGVAIVAVTALLGIVATLLWWRRADQTG